MLYFCECFETTLQLFEANYSKQFSVYIQCICVICRPIDVYFVYTVHMNEMK